MNENTFLNILINIVKNPALLDEVQTVKKFIEKINKCDIEKEALVSFLVIYELKLEEKWKFRYAEDKLKNVIDEFCVNKLLEALFEYCKHLIYQDQPDEEFLITLISGFSRILKILSTTEHYEVHENLNHVHLNDHKFFLEKFISDVLKTILINTLSKNKSNGDVLEHNDKVVHLLCEFLNIFLILINENDIKISDFFMSEDIPLVNGCDISDMSFANILILLLKKINLFISKGVYKLLCASVYSNGILYFQKVNKDELFISYLNEILFQNEEINDNTKLSLTIFIFSTIASYVENILNLKSECDHHNISKTGFRKSNFLLSNVCGCDSFVLNFILFYAHLKHFTFDKLGDLKTPTRKLALYLVKRFYQLEKNNMDKKTIDRIELFFHIYETLEESQVNLILPVLNNLSLLCEKSRSSQMILAQATLEDLQNRENRDKLKCISVEAVDLVFIQSVLVRMLQHESVTIIKIAFENLHLLNNNLIVVPQLLPTIFQALNNSTLFVPESNAVKNNLLELFKAVNTPFNETDHCILLLQNIIRTPWGPIPLFYVIHYLQLSSENQNCEVLKPPSYSLETKLMNVLKHLTTLVYIDFKHNIVLRSAMEICLIKYIENCIISPLQHFEVVNNVRIASMVITLFHVINKKFHHVDLQKLYESFANALNFTENFMNNFLEFKIITETNEIDLDNLRLVSLSLLSKSISVEKIIQVLSSKLMNSSKTITSVVRNNVKKIIDWSDECDNIGCESSNDLLFDFLLKYCKIAILSGPPCRIKLSSWDELFPLNTLDDDIRYIKWWLAFDKVKFSLLYYINNFKYDGVNIPFDHEYKYLLYLLYLINRDEWRNLPLENDAVNYLFNNFMSLKKIVTKKECKKLLNLKLNLARDCQLFHKNPIFYDFDFFENNLSDDILSSITRDNLPSLFFIVKNYFSLNFNEDFEPQILERINEFIKNSWLEVKNSRKTTNYRKMIKYWIEMIYQRNILHNKIFFKTLQKYTDLILEHEESGYFLYKHLASYEPNLLFSTTYKKMYNEDFILFLILRGLIYGDLPKKDIHNEKVVCDIICENNFFNNSMKFGEWHHSRYIRQISVIFMWYYVDTVNHERFVELIDHLMKLFDGDQSKSQYFNNSLTHRIKQRSVQAILFCKTRPLRKTQVIWALENILIFNHQPSVRYFLEWLILIECHDIGTDSHKIFWDYFNKSLNERPGSVVSFLSILFHMVKIKCSPSAEITSPTIERFLDDVFKKLISCCMSQQFNIRLYAHVIFSKLYREFKLCNNIKNKYQMFYTAIMTISESAKGNAIINCEKLKNDFYFTKFYPLKQFTLETIYYDIPKIANVANDEWIPVSEFEKNFKIFDASSPFQFFKNGRNHSLEHVAKPEWIMSNTNRNQTDSLVSQKKFIPWKSMEVDTCSSPSLESTDLIVVTSLIDKMPNVGGLSRTSEIFGATLVVENLEIMKDVQFKALSMTSEKHLNIIEVRKHNLKQYLIQKKTKENYTLIGAEQTNSSVDLQHFKYPKKSILVLGNEKDGVPSDILILLDSFVEVPQLGVLRSLNVHVTGALFIWEYVKQHSL